MANLDRVPRRLRPSTVTMIDNGRDLMTALANGEISIYEWHEAMERLIVRHHTAAMMLGMDKTSLADEVIDLLEKTIQIQLDYLLGFRNDIESKTDYFPLWRSDLYALAQQSTFQEGEIIRKIGRALPLPAMKGQGTQCHTNCGCEWRIVKLKSGEGNYNCYWERHKDDSCQTCIIREREWSPVYIRDWALMPEGYRDTLKEQKRYKVTQAMKTEARRGLDWRKEFNRGGTDVGINRARQILNSDYLSAKTLITMWAWFRRHEVDKQGQGYKQGEKGYPSNGRIAWALWGGDAGYAWAKRYVEGAKSEKHMSGKHNQSIVISLH